MVSRSVDFPMTPMPRLPHSRLLRSPRWTRLVTLAGLATVLAGCGTTRLREPTQATHDAPRRPGMIHVADFDLDASRIRSDPGPMQPPEPPNLPFGEGLPPAPWRPKEAGDLAKSLTETLSSALVHELQKAGWPARRLNPKAPTPSSGWLLRGSITEANTGNQLRRAVVGWGEGMTELGVAASLEDLDRKAPAEVTDWDVAARSGKVPGAGPLVALGPGALAVRWVMAGKDLEKNVRESASRIAAEVLRRIDGSDPGS